jgi:hypothetical protein
MRVDMAGVARRKRRMVDEVIALHLDRFKASGAELVMGKARFMEPKTVRVTLRGVPYTALRNAIFAHPTAAEGLDGLFANALTAPAPNQSDLPS